MPSGARCVGPSLTCLQAQSRSALLFWPTWLPSRFFIEPTRCPRRRAGRFLGVEDARIGPNVPMYYPDSFLCWGCYFLSLSSALARGTTACVACAEETRRSANKLQTPKWHRPQHAFSCKTIIKIESSCIIRKSCASTMFAQMQSVHNFCWGE